VLTPTLPQECSGTVAHVVFPTGIDRRDDLGLSNRFDVYYGMADSRIGVARLDLPDLLPAEGIADLQKEAYKRTLAVAEQTCARMSLSQWRRSARLAEIGCPVPVPDLRHVFQVLSNVVVMFVQLPVERVDYVRNL